MLTPYCLGNLLLTLYLSCLCVFFCQVHLKSSLPPPVVLIVGLCVYLGLKIWSLWECQCFPGQDERPLGGFTSSSDVPVQSHWVSLLSRSQSCVVESSHRVSGMSLLDILLSHLLGRCCTLLCRLLLHHDIVLCISFLPLILGNLALNNYL